MQQTIAERFEPNASRIVTLFCLNPTVAAVLFRFLLQQTYGVLVMLDPDVEAREAQSGASIVIVSKKSFDWMLAIGCEHGAAIEAWVVEPFASILAFLEGAAEFSRLDRRYAEVFRASVPRSRWVRLPDLCMSSHLLSSWLTKILPSKKGLTASIPTEEARLSLVAKLAAVPQSVSDARLQHGVTYRVRHGHVGCLCLGAGWYPPEVEHVWMFGTRAQIVLPLPHNASDHSICRMKLQQLAATNYVRVLVDGVETLGFSITTDAPSFRYIDVPLSLTRSASGPTIIDFVCSVAWKPCDVDKNLVDRRSIGIGLCSIELLDGSDKATAKSQNACVWQLDIGEPAHAPFRESLITGLITAGCARTFHASQVPGLSADGHARGRFLSLFIIVDAGTSVVLPLPGSLPLHYNIFRGDLPGLAGLWASMANAPWFLRTETFTQAVECLDAIDADLAMGTRVVQVVASGSEPDESQRSWIAKRFSRVSYSPCNGWTLVH